jgi:hypothetical protein
MNAAVLTSSPAALEADTPIISCDLKFHGYTTGGRYRCRRAGCAGFRLVVRWSDGTRTHPCTEAMRFDEKRRYWRSAEGPFGNQ